MYSIVAKSLLSVLDSVDTELESLKVNAADEYKVSSSLKKIGDGWIQAEKQILILLYKRD